MTKLQLINHGFFLKEDWIYPDDMNRQLLAIWMGQCVTPNVTAVLRETKSRTTLKKNKYILKNAKGKDVNENACCIKSWRTSRYKFVT